MQVEVTQARTKIGPKQVRLDVGCTTVSEREKTRKQAIFILSASNATKFEVGITRMHVLATPHSAKFCPPLNPADKTGIHTVCVVQFQERLWIRYPTNFLRNSQSRPESRPGPVPDFLKIVPSPGSRSREAESRVSHSPALDLTDLLRAFGTTDTKGIGYFVDWSLDCEVYNVQKNK
uniref:Uncharacterized protein n=1 Tax=Steinernema glaseri TaxID=37863 RepID=A0A1I7YRP7_9BILA